MDTDEDSGTTKIPQIPSHSPEPMAFSPPSSPSVSNAAVSAGLTSRPDVEKSPIVPSEGSHAVESQRPKISRSMSLTKVFNPELKRASDLFTLPAGRSYPESSHGGCIVEPPMSTNSSHYRKELAQKWMHRSYSVPVIRKDGSVSLHGNVVHLIPTSPQMGKAIDSTLCKSPAYDNEKKVDSGEPRISEEEAVCRICLIELGNGPDTIKMECNCKGELAVAHQECAIKWFSTKGNRICDVCTQEVRNLPVTLLRVHNNVQAYNFQGIQPAEVIQYRVCQDVPFLVIINMLAYFGFLEQLLAGKMGSGALAISLPFSCIFGLLASMTAATMVWKQYIWIYAIVQLSFVIAFSHLFYTKLQMQPIVAVLLATFSGFGVTMSLSSILEKILQRARPWLNRSTHQTLPMVASNGSSTITHQMQANPPLDLQRQPEESMQRPRASPAALHHGQIDPPGQDIEMGGSRALH